MRRTQPDYSFFLALCAHYVWVQSFVRFCLFPGVPFFNQFAVHNSGDVDSQQGNGFPSVPYLNMSGHTGNNLFAVDQLIFNAKGVSRVDEEFVEVQDALTKALQIPVAR